MRELVIVWGLLGAACYAPHVPTGAPCDDEHPCPSALVCAKSGTCQLADSLGSEVDANLPEPDACVPSGVDTCSDGIDQNCDGFDPPCASNDVTADAIEVTSGGTFNADLATATDSFEQKGCGGAGGRDVFYEVSLAAAQVYYFDTFASNFDTVLRAFPGVACASLAAGMGPSCNDDACNTGNSQLALELPAGRSCIVIDADAAATTGNLVFRVTPGGRTGTALATGMPTLTGTTCTSTDADNPSDPSCVGGATTSGKDIGLYTTVCPGETRHLSATTCEDVTVVEFDTVLYVQKAGNSADLRCHDDTPTCALRAERTDMHVDGTVLTDVPLVGPGLFWLVLDAYDANDCGTYRLDFTLN